MSTSGITCAYVIFLFAACAVFSFWTQSNLNFWLSYFKGTAVYVPYWLSFLLTLVLNGVIFVANLVASLARYLV